MNDMTDRQRQAEALANAQIPGLPVEDRDNSNPSMIQKSRLIYMSWA